MATRRVRRVNDMLFWFVFFFLSFLQEFNLYKKYYEVFVSHWRKSNFKTSYELVLKKFKRKPHSCSKTSFPLEFTVNFFQWSHVKNWNTFPRFQPVSFSNSHESDMSLCVTFPCEYFMSTMVVIVIRQTTHYITTFRSSLNRETPFIYT